MAVTMTRVGHPSESLMYSSYRNAGHPPASGRVMDHVRYLLGIFAFIVYAPGLLFWFVIHPWARWWRKLGPPRTYLIACSMLAAPGFTGLSGPWASPWSRPRNQLDPDWGQPTLLRHFCLAWT